MIALKKCFLILCLIALGLSGIYACHRRMYPYGASHCCISQFSMAFVLYAEKHDGKFPAGEATPEASLSLLYREFPNWSLDYLLRGMTVPGEVTKRILKSGQLLGPDSCGWHYVEGLTQADDPNIAILWCKEPLGHNGQKTSDGGRQVLTVAGCSRWVTSREWPAFLAEQETYFSNRNPDVIPVGPRLTAQILLSDGVLTNQYSGPCKMYIYSRSPNSGGGGWESFESLNSSNLTWYPHPHGTMILKLETPSLVSDFIRVKRGSDGDASNIVFRMKAR